MQTPFGIGLVGCGVVGSGVVRLLLEQSAHLRDRAGRPLELRSVVVRELAKQRPVTLPRDVLSTSLDRLCDDPTIQVGIELIGGLEPARTIILRMLEFGKDVVTANKAVLAKHGAELFAAAKRHGRTIAFEASVGGGIPIVGAIRQGLAANRFQSIQAILNGTSNFILTQMTEEGQGYEEALRAAQRLGYAEADPTLDVNGSDSAHKLCILARLAFGRNVAPEVVERRGIEGIAQADVRYAGELGYVVKLLAEAWLEDRQIALHVEPSLLRRHDPLAQVRGAYNAIHVVGDAVGDTLYYGPGAGSMPTASAVVADVIDLAIGRGQLTFAAARLWENNEAVGFRSSASIHSRFYLRINAEDKPGVLAEVARLLAERGISIASVMQHEATEEHADTVVPVVIMTHQAKVGDFRAAALADIDAMTSIASPSVYFPVAE